MCVRMEGLSEGVASLASEILRETSLLETYNEIPRVGAPSFTLHNTSNQDFSEWSAESGLPNLDTRQTAIADDADAPFGFLALGAERRPILVIPGHQCNPCAANCRKPTCIFRSQLQGWSGWFDTATQQKSCYRVHHTCGRLQQLERAGACA